MLACVFLLSVNFLFSCLGLSRHNHRLQWIWKYYHASRFVHHATDGYNRRRILCGSVLPAFGTQKNPEEAMSQQNNVSYLIELHDA